MKSITKASVALVAAATLVAGSAVAAAAYPVSVDPTVTFSKTSYRAGETARVKARNVYSRCRVTFSFDNVWTNLDDDSDYDTNDAVVDPMGEYPDYQTNWTPLQAPRFAGQYAVTATVGLCRYDYMFTARPTLNVGKQLTITKTIVSSKTKTVTVSGTLKLGAVAQLKQPVIINLYEGSNGSGRLVKSVTVKTTKTGYTNKFLKLTKNATYYATITLPQNPLYWIAATNGTVTSTRVKVVR